jgi:hypothetical protein
MDESKNGGIVVFRRDVWELLAIPGFGSPKMLAVKSSVMLDLGCSGGGAAKEGSC